jgi:hypothetical protein
MILSTIAVSDCEYCMTTAYTLFKAKLVVVTTKKAIKAMFLFILVTHIERLLALNQPRQSNVFLA